MNRRIVITGMGAVSPLGCGVETVWSRLLAGQSGIRALPEDIGALLPVKIGGSVPDITVDPLAGFMPESVVALEHALARGAQPIAEIVGYGTSADAYHMTSGPEDGDGAYRAMSLALRQAAIAPEQVQHINAHATSTPVGDLGEINAIKRLFGEKGGTAIASTKSATGHLLGAAGGIETLFTALALRDQRVPATLNLTHPDPAAAGLHLVSGGAISWPITYALSNGFGFGGVNASILLKKWPS